MNKSTLAIAALAAIIAVSPAAAEQKIAVLDLEKIVLLHPNTAHDKELLSASVKEMSAQREALAGSVKKARDDFEAAAKEADNPALSEKARTAKIEEAAAKREAAIDALQAADKKMRELQKQLSEQELRMLKVTTDEIRKVVETYAKANGISLILQLPSDRIGSGSGVLYSDGSMDITKAIMDKMGIKDAPVEPAATPSAK